METTKKINGQKAVLFVVGVALGSTPVLPASGAMVKSAEAAAVSTSSLDLPLVVINVIDAEAAAVSTSSLDQEQAKYDRMVSRATSVTNEALKWNSMATSVLADQTKASAAAKSAAAAAAAAKAGLDKSGAAISKLKDAYSKANDAANAAAKAAEIGPSDLDKKRASAKQAVEAALSAVSSAGKDLDSANARYNDLAATSAKLSVLIKSLTDKAASLKTSVTAATTANTKAQTALTAAKAALDKAASALKSNKDKTKVDALQKAYDSASKALDGATAAAQSAAADFDKVNGPYKEVNAALADATSKAKSASTDLAAAQKTATAAGLAYTKAKSAVETAKKAADTAETAYQAGLAKLKTASDTAAKARDAAGESLKIAQKDYDAAIDNYKQLASTLDEAAQRASDIASKYKEVKANADAAAANAKEIAAGIATQKKVVDGLIAAKAKEDAAAAAKLVGMFSDDGTNSNGLTFKQEIQEQLPRVMGAKGMDGPNVLTITDSSYDQVQCRYGITWDAFGREWRDAKLSLMGKKKVWLMPIDAEAPNGRYYLSCKAIQKDAAIYSGTFEFIMQEWMSGTDWAKSRCDFPVTGISDQTYFAAAAKVLSAKGVVQSVGLVPDPEAEEMSVAVFEEPRAVLAKKDAYAEERVLSRAVKSDFPLSTLKPFEIAEEGYRTGWEVSRKWRKKGIRAFNTVSQPYFGNFGKAQFVGASVSKKISMSPDGKFLLVRRGWSNPGSGCNLPGVMGAVKRQANSSSPMRWLKTRFLKPIFVEGLKTALFPMSKTAPSRGGKNVYNTNIKTGTVFVMNSKGQGILMDDKGTVTRRFTNAPRYLKRMFKRHSLVGDVRELGFKREKH